jgi:hypothetical protein
MLARVSTPLPPQAARRRGASRFLEQGRPDLLPGDDIGRILLMARDAVIQLGALLFGQRKRVGLQAFPDGIQQFRLLSSRESFNLVSQIAHRLYASAVSTVRQAQAPARKTPPQARPALGWGTLEIVGWDTRGHSMVRTHAKGGLPVPKRNAT